MMILDQYFKRPIVWDCVIASFLTLAVFLLRRKNILHATLDTNLYSIVSDLSTIGLTMAGFILTLLTVLVSWKSTTKPFPKDQRNYGEATAFEMFFSTPYYFETVRHLKWAIVSLTILSITGFSLKLFLKTDLYHLLYFFNAFGIIIILFTMIRSVMILSQIIKLQKHEGD
jgi:hypothetical protein